VDQGFQLTSGQWFTYQEIQTWFQETYLEEWTKLTKDLEEAKQKLRHLVLQKEEAEARIWRARRNLK
jgi:hypothetical protein